MNTSPNALLTGLIFAAMLGFSIASCVLSR